MFIVATNDRESYGTPGIAVARTVEDVRDKFVRAWGELYDASTVTLLVVNEDDMSTSQIFYADSDGQLEELTTVVNPDGTESAFAEIYEGALARLDEALAPYAGA